MVFLDEFRRFVEAAYLSAHTRRAYLSDVKEFLKYGGSFDERGLSGFVVFLRRKGCSSSTIKRKLSSLSVFFNFLKGKGVVDKNPVEFVIRPKIDKHLPGFLDVDETKHLLESIKDVRDRAIMELLYSSSLRASELVGLDVSDIDFQRLRLRVKRKGGFEMYVPMTKRASEHLKTYVGERKEGAVFLNRYGRRLTTRGLQNIVKKYALIVLFKDISPHTLRHTRATHLISNNMDVRVLQKLLGHSSVKATEVYTHVNLKRLAETYDGSHPLASDD